MKVRTEIRLDGMQVLSDIIEKGCAVAWHRVNKHRDCLCSTDDDVAVKAIMEKLREHVDMEAVPTKAQVGWMLTVVKELSTCPTKTHDDVIIAELHKHIMDTVHEYKEEEDGEKDYLGYATDPARAKARQYPSPIVLLNTIQNPPVDYTVSTSNNTSDADTAGIPRSINTCYPVTSDCE
jgi:hypothetical protein